MIARPDDGDRESARGPATSPAGRRATTAKRAEPRPPQPETERIRVRGGEPVGGVRVIRVERGERVRLRVSSPDTSEEVHVHGYELRKDLAPRRPVTFAFPAKLEGVFEIELERTHVQIAELVVEPR